MELSVRPRLPSLALNYFAHAHRFLVAGEADPYFLAGAAVPDWLNVVARRSRCRRQHVQPHLSHPDPAWRALAYGIAQHHEDDLWFHGTRAFTELSLRFAKRIHGTLADESDLRAGFLGHILVELLLDAELIAGDPQQLERYYMLIDSVDAAFVAEAIAHMVGQPVGQLRHFISRFVDIRFLVDYQDDVRLCQRVTQVLDRVGLPPLPGQFGELIPAFRAAVREHESLLLPADNCGSSKTIRCVFSAAATATA